MINIKEISNDHLEQIGNILGYKPSAAKSKARRFCRGLNGELVNWEYDEIINYGEMGKVLSIINLLQKNNYLS